jgi:hypothetical protein
MGANDVLMGGLVAENDTKAHTRGATPNAPRLLR